MNLNTLRNLSAEFEKQAQQLAMTAQAGDIQTVLERANLWNMAKAVSPLLDAVGVPDTSAVHIAILVSPGPRISFNAVVDPTNPNISKKLNLLLAQKFSTPMANAIKTARLSVEGALVINWLKF